MARTLWPEPCSTHATPDPCPICLPCHSADSPREAGCGPSKRRVFLQPAERRSCPHSTQLAQSRPSHMEGGVDWVDGHGRLHPVIATNMVQALPGWAYLFLSTLASTYPRSLSVWSG